MCVKDYRMSDSKLVFTVTDCELFFTVTDCLWLWIWNSIFKWFI